MEFLPELRREDEEGVVAVVVAPDVTQAEQGEFTPIEDALRSAKKWPLLPGQREVAEIREVARVLAQYDGADAATPERCQRIGEYYRDVMSARGMRSWKLGFILRDWGDFLVWLQEKGLETPSKGVEDASEASRLVSVTDCPVCHARAAFIQDVALPNEAFCRVENQFYCPSAESETGWKLRFG